MTKYIIIYSLYFLLCQPLFSNAFHGKNNETDQFALLSLKSHITWDVHSSPILSNWSDETSVCHWIGVKCSPLHNRVVALNVSNFGLNGTIPPHIGNLSFLRSIDVSSNNFQGQLPQEFGNLRRLIYIRLHVNNFNGNIPSWFGSFPHLKWLNLRNNSFSGSLPSLFFNATKLEVCSFFSNQLNGNIPEEIGNLRNLKIFDMQANQLEGSLPLSIFNLSSLQTIALTGNRLNGNLPLHICSKLPKLAGAYLSKNQFSGKLESRFGNCSELQLLSASYNSFTGQIPQEIVNLTGLVELDLSKNQFQGEIPAGFGSLENLEFLKMHGCSLSGQIPTDIGNLDKLSELILYGNFLSGVIPPPLFNISSLSMIELDSNNLTGNLPPIISEQLPNLEELTLFSNKLSGAIPDTISNLTKLDRLELADNRFTGSIPTTLGNLRFLKRFLVNTNYLTTDSMTRSLFIESLARCRSFLSLSVTQNPLNIPLLPSIGNLSSSLRTFDANSCGITGNIPPEIGNLTGLYALSLSYNSLTGSLPNTIQRISKLQGLYFGGNQITGIHLHFLCNMKLLTELYLEGNILYGQVPGGIGNMTSLTTLMLERNELNSTLPTEVGNLTNLLVLDVHSNYLSGNIPPTLGGLITALSIDLSENSFSGYIPPSIGSIGSLVQLLLARNKLQGTIPEMFGNLLSLEMLNLSHNNLTGEIPARLATLLELRNFNVSFNHLRGRIPSNGSFLNFTVDSFMSNDALCGGAPNLLFPPCIDDSHKKGSRRKTLRKVAYILAPIALLVILTSCLIFMFLKKRVKAGNVAQVALVPTSNLQRVSFYDIQQATNRFHESNLIGAGSFGSVYKGLLRDGTTLAIKVFNLELEGAFKSFETECDVISKIRHRNLVKVISSCSNLDFKAVVLEYMPSGSLERWLYSHDHFLDFLQRLNIMIDVVSALDYLHHGNTSPTVHCDLKPNVLLDEQMIGHVCDFGISKLLGGDESMVQTMTLATIGYTAPEYGSEGLVSTSCDVYSFGILMMETFSRRKPTEDMFAEGFGLREMVADGLRNHTIDFIDQNLLNPEDQSLDKIITSIGSLMHLALRCVRDSPEQRMDARDVFLELQKIKFLFLSQFK